MSETKKARNFRRENLTGQFGEMNFLKYMRTPGLDIGFKGHAGKFESEYGFIGVDTDYPGYDGEKLPFPDESQQTVYSSHCLEHITESREAIIEWFRVLKTGGHLVITVPHQFLYEKKVGLPSRWNRDHKRFYTPSRLLLEIEQALIPNTYRIVYLRDAAEGFDYEKGPDQHSVGRYEIELVVYKIKPPKWSLAKP